MSSWVHFMTIRHLYTPLGSHKQAVIATVLLCVGCGGSPTQPPPVDQPPPVSQTWTITGTVTTTLTGEPVAGASLKFSDRTVTTNSAGRWSINGTGIITSPTFAVEVSVTGYLTRKTSIRAENGRDVAIDLIRDAAPFNLGFYRQLVRNDFDTPGQLRHTRKWIVAPKFYINTFNPRTNSAISDGELQGIATAIRETLPQATGGMYSNPVIESGTGSRTSDGFIEVRITYDPNGDEFGPYCGRAQVAANPGWIKINYASCSSACGSAATASQVTAHELGHAMGLWHTNEGGIMTQGVASRCGQFAMSDSEKYHARILYSRPVGNADVDWDQPSTPLLQAFLSQPAPVVTCFRR